MDQTNLYEFITKRKSIRKYDLTPLDQDTLGSITSYMHTVKPLYDSIQVDMKLVSQNDVNNLLSINAPHYIIVSSEKKEGYLTHVGFMLQQVDLFLSSIGIGSCWLGMGKPSKSILTTSELEFVIVLALGKSKEPLHRMNISEFKRKPIEAISNVHEEDSLLSAVRLAPSATNSQPWYFIRSGDRFHAYCIKNNMVKAILYEKMNKIDMGIAICHLWLAAVHTHKNMKCIQDMQAQGTLLSGYTYLTTLQIQ